MRGRWALGAALVLWAMTGCGDDGAPGVDASVVREDAGGGATPDAGSTDRDDDGIEAGADCDDEDETVGASATRTCTGPCGEGEERCSGGTWGACDAPTDCACDTPGAMRLVACERCGMRSERCSDERRWESASECLGQGECDVADVETRMTPRCGTEQRLCGSECGWGGWTTVTADGECAAGEEHYCVLATPSFTRFCTAECEWDRPCLPD